MGTSVNKVTLVGRLGRDPEVRYTSGGAGVANLALATDETWKDKTTGEKMTRTEWHKLVSWISTDFIKDYLHKGDLIYVEGRLQTKEWTDKEQVKRSTVEINVIDIKPLITAKSDSAPSGSRPPQQRAAAAARPAQRPAPQEIDDTDIPF